ncbi:unnamed protein product [Arctogadus glacialis]
MGLRWCLFLRSSPCSVCMMYDRGVWHFLTTVAHLVRPLSPWGPLSVMSSFGQPHLAKMFFRLAMVIAADMLVRELVGGATSPNEMQLTCAGLAQEPVKQP